MRVLIPILCLLTLSACINVPEQSNNTPNTPDAGMDMQDASPDLREDMSADVSPDLKTDMPDMVDMVDMVDMPPPEGCTKEGMLNGMAPLLCDNQDGACQGITFDACQQVSVPMDEVEASKSCLGEHLAVAIRKQKGLPFGAGEVFQSLEKWSCAPALDCRNAATISDCCGANDTPMSENLLQTNNEGKTPALVELSGNEKSRYLMAYAKDSTISLVYLDELGGLVKKDSKSVSSTGGILARHVVLTRLSDGNIVLTYAQKGSTSASSVATVDQFGLYYLTLDQDGVVDAGPPKTWRIFDFKNGVGNVEDDVTFDVHYHANTLWLGAMVPENNPASVISSNSNGYMAGLCFKDLNGNIGAECTFRAVRNLFADGNNKGQSFSPEIGNVSIHAKSNAEVYLAFQFINTNLNEPRDLVVVFDRGNVSLSRPGELSVSNTTTLKRDMKLSTFDVLNAAGEIETKFGLVRADSGAVSITPIEYPNGSVSFGTPLPIFATQEKVRHLDFLDHPNVEGRMLLSLLTDTNLTVHGVSASSLAGIAQHAPTLMAQFTSKDTEVILGSQAYSTLLIQGTNTGNPLGDTRTVSLGWDGALMCHK